MAKTARVPRSGPRSGDGGGRDFWKIYGPAVLLTLAGFLLAYLFVEPAPPRRLTIATGGPQGAYHGTAARYRDILARDGITLELRSTRGSIENLALLQAEDGGVEVAFVQGGTGAAAAAGVLRGLASLYYEPLWIFTRTPEPLTRISDLAGLRLAVGAEGSGTRAVALRLLADNGLAGGLSGGGAELLPRGGVAAADALLAGRAEAAFFVAGASAPVVRRLLEAPGISAMSLARAEAYRRRYPYFSRVTLPEGVIDFAANLPFRDIVLLAPSATLAAREDLHPALQVLLLQAAAEVHGTGGIFEQPGEFPSARFLELPLSKTAARYFRAGPPFLQRYLPFWAADLIDRLKILLLPLVTLLIPLLRIVPPTYRWRVRSRIYRWYRELQAVEDGLEEPASAEERARRLAELDRIEADVRQVSVPLSYADALYHLRLHIDLVRDKLTRLDPPR